MDWLARTRRLIGEDDVQKLRKCHALVAGLGGVGGMCAEALMRGGVGHLSLLDCDAVAQTNLNRQIVALRSTMGRPKAEALAERFADISLETCVTPLVERLTADTAEARVRALAPDVVLDCIDNVPAKAALIAACARLGIPVFSSMGTGNRLDPSRLHVCDIYETKNDPLARVMRQRLRSLGVERLTVVCSSETPVTPAAPPPEERTATPGSAAFVPPAAGLMLAALAFQSLRRR